MLPRSTELDYRTERFLALFVAKVRGIAETVEIYDGLDEPLRFTGKPIERVHLELKNAVLSAVASHYINDTSAVLEAALMGAAKM